MKNKKSKKTRANSTQTDPIKVNFCPKIVLTRISFPEVTDKLNSRRSNLLNNSMIPVKHKFIRNVPKLYVNFAKPITNNENVNSTLVSAQEFEINNPVTRRRSNQLKRMKFKPGPLSYKRKLLKNQERHDDSEMDIPIMLNEKSSTPLENARNLGTILEQIHDEISQTLHVSLNIHSVELEEVPGVEVPSNSSLNIALRNLDNEEGTEGDKTNDSSDQRKVATPKLRSHFINRNNADEIKELLRTQKKCTATRDQCTANQPCTAQKITEPDIENEFTSALAGQRIENTNIHFKGVTTIVSHKSFHGERRVSSSSSEENEDRSDKSGSFGPDMKFMKVVAQTVHIHNHFYTS